MCEFLFVIVPERFYNHVYINYCERIEQLYSTLAAGKSHQFKTLNNH